AGGAGGAGRGGRAGAPGGGARPAGAGRDLRRAPHDRDRPTLPGHRRRPGPEPPGAGRQGRRRRDAPVLARRPRREPVVTDISSEEPPGGGGRRGPLTRRGRVVLGVVAVLLVVGLGGGLWVLRQVGRAGGAASGGRTSRFGKLPAPGGLTLGKIADRVAAVPGRSKERFLAAARSGGVRSKWQPPGNTSLEGLLFPDTYLATDNEDETAI